MSQLAGLRATQRPDLLAGVHPAQERLGHCGGTATLPMYGRSTLGTDLPTPRHVGAPPERSDCY
jgi:hypothetical protein